MRLIDADALRESVLKWLPHDPCGVEENEHPYETDICVSMLMEIEDAPTIEPERKKRGRWIYGERREPVYDLGGVKTWGIAYKCFECGFIHTVIEDFGRYVFCPNCGEKMEGEE